MKILTILLLTITSLFSYEYYSKAAPYEQFLIKSDVSGKVVYSDEFKEGKNGDGSIVIKIDDFIDRVDLNTTKLEIKNLKSIIKNSKQLYEIDKRAYEKIKNLSTYSETQKDAKKIKMLTSYTNLLNQQINLSKLNLKLKTLQDKINKKNIKISHKYYIYKIYPKVGDFVNFGSPLIEIADLSQAKLIIFVTYEDLQKIKQNKITIDGKKIKYKIVKMLKIADSKNISGYKVELVIPAPKVFSSLVKIEIK